MLPTSLPVTERRQSFLAQYQSTNLRYSVYRHIMVLETSYKRLFSFIPRVVLEAKSLAYDPLSPPTTVNQYDQDFFQGIDDLYSPRIRSRRQRANDKRRLALRIYTPTIANLDEWSLFVVTGTLASLLDKYA
jgi:hypothetical protein